MDPLIIHTPAGLYCPQADIYIDPIKTVTRALITHAHSDHAISGHRYYLATPLTNAIIKQRLGNYLQVQDIHWGTSITMNGVRISFHPAGHIAGSSQIRLEYKGNVWVVTGDYKTEKDQISGTYELIQCNTLITETTFALPIYQWKPQHIIVNEILSWYHENLGNDRTTVVLAYALGKAQRVIQNIPIEIPVYTHTTVEETNDALRKAGLKLRPTIKISSKTSKKEILQGIVIIPYSVLNTPWLHALHRPVTATVSGWMAIMGNRKKQTADRGFALSDHVDWNQVNKVIRDCGAESIGLMHGYTLALSRWLTNHGKHSFIIPHHLNQDQEVVTEED